MIGGGGDEGGPETATTAFGLSTVQNNVGESVDGCRDERVGSYGEDRQQRVHVLQRRRQNDRPFLG